MGGALEQESQACVTAKLLVTSEFTMPVDGWNCAHIGATDPFGLCSLNKSAALHSKALLPLLLQLSTRCHRQCQHSLLLDPGSRQCLLKSKPANQGQLRERAGKTLAFPPPIKTSLRTIHPPALQ